MERFPLGTQTLYAELMELLLTYGTHRSIGHLPGCFTTKSIKGEVYYYYQYSAPGGDLKQVYSYMPVDLQESFRIDLLGSQTGNTGCISLLNSKAKHEDHQPQKSSGHPDKTEVTRNAYL